MKHVGYLMLIAFTLSSCKGPVKYTEEKFGTFSMKIADFLSPQKNDAFRSSAFYQDTVNNCVLAVVEESKDSMIAYGQKYDLHAYFDKTYISLADKMDNRKLLKDHRSSYADTINSHLAVVSRIPSQLGEEELVYFLAVIETKKAFYQVIFGMPSDQETRYTKPVHVMIESFKGL